MPRLEFALKKPVLTRSMPSMDASRQMTRDVKPLPFCVLNSRREQTTLFSYAQDLQNVRDSDPRGLSLLPNV